MVDPAKLDDILTDLTKVAAKVAALKSPIIVTPPQPSNTVHTKDFPGDDLGAKINAAEEELGDREGSIIVSEPGTIATQVILNKKASAGRKIYFPDGEFPVVNPADGSRVWQGAILQNHRTHVFGSDKTTFIEPAKYGWIVFQAYQDSRVVGGYANGEVTEDLVLDNITVRGANTAAEGGVRSTVNYGNAKKVRISRVKLMHTSCLGITAGGHALSGNHAQDWIVSKCYFEGVASQALNAVNAIDFVFEDSDFINSGKFPDMGMTPIDLEPNAPTDVIQNGVIRNNRIDSSGSPFVHGNAILAQNGVGTADYSALIEDNKIKGGFKVTTGIYIAGQYRLKHTNEPISVEFARANPDQIRTNWIENVVVRNNEVEGVVHSLYRFEVGRRLLLENNRGVSDGVGGSEKTEVELFDVVDSKVKGFRLKLTEPHDRSAKLRMYERGISARNVYEDNVPGVERKE